MIKPGTKDLEIYRGSTDRFAFRIIDTAGTPLPFDDIRLTISSKTSNDPTTGLILRKSVLGVEDFGPEVIDEYTDDPNPLDYDEYSGTVIWTPTPAESRALPKGAKSKYEVELRNGTSQIIYIIGTITGTGGINDDD